MKYTLLILIFIFNLNILFAQENTYSLDQAVDFAITNSYASKNASLDIDKAEKKSWETTTIGLPQINANVDYQNFIRQPISLIPAAFFGGAVGEFAEVNFGTKQNINASATLSQLLFDGSYLVGLQSAKVFLKISELAKIKTEQAIREAVINAYGNVLLTRESITILENNVKIITKNINDTQQIFENGFAEEQDVEQLKITRATLKNQLNRSNRLLEVAKNMLKITMGIVIDRPINLTETLESLVQKNMDLELYATAFNLDNHIDYKIAQNSVTASELLMKFEKSKALPSLSAFINYAVTANNDNFRFIESEQKWFGSSLFGVSLNVPIFSSFKRDAKTQQAKIVLNQSQIKLDETAQKLKLQVASTKANYQFAIENYQTTKENLDLAKRIEKKEQIKFFEGVSTSFNLSQAQNQLYTIQQQYLQAIVAIINAKVGLESALNQK
ncbi:MAG: TolC family protein [Flavobacteriaceae bacterium]|nr:TolC family protein [Flavobacteriaceae bacterium]